MKTAEENIRQIEHTFREVQEALSSEVSLLSIAKLADSYPPLFRSVAYEATSMHLALKAIKQGDELVEWSEFLTTYAAHHKTQYYIGLGWALAQEQVEPQKYCQQWSERVADGCGYYEGMFRRRKVLHQQQLPNWNETFLSNYLQGLGRSIWYISLGDVALAAKTVQLFPQQHHSALWRGLGIALTYTGGSSETDLYSLKEMNEDVLPFLLEGVELAIQSRLQAASPTEDMLVVKRILAEK